MTSGAVSRPSLGVFVPDCPAHLRNVIPTDMTLDSRELLPGGLFVALPGTASDGRRFIGDVLSRGASAVLAEADGLEKPPYPGEIGDRIYHNISQAAWQQWLARSVMIINEYQLNSSDAAHQELIEKHLLGFLFNEGEYGQLPEGYNPR